MTNKNCGQKINKEFSKRNWEYYKNIYPEWSKEQCEEKAKYFRKSCNYNSKEYYIVNYPDLTDEEREEIRKEKQKEMRKNNKTKIEYYQTHFPELTSEEQYNMWHDFNQSRNAQSIKFYERKYPELSHEEHLKMLEDYKRNYLSNRKPWTGANNCNSKENTTEYQRRSRSPRCIEFYQRKYPNNTSIEHEQMLKDYFEQNRLKIKNAIKDTNLEYYLQQGMSEIEARLALKQRQTTFSLAKCIEKYGEDGERIFKERQKKWIKSLKKNFSNNGFTNLFQSKLGNLIITDIAKYLKLNENDLDNYTEYYIHDYENNRGFVYDFIYENKIIEINGDYWHCNPNIYSADFYNISKQKTAQELWDIDKRKTEIAKIHGFDILVIWENDYNTEPDKTIKKCINFLLNETICN